MGNLVDDRVGADVSLSTAGSGQSQARIDVQIGLSSTRRELGLAICDRIGDEVILGERTLEDGLGRPLCGFSAEEVDSLLNGSNTRIQVGISTVVSLVDGVRPTL